jgi:hypothetical protein
LLREVRLAQSSRIDGLPLPTLLRSAPAPGNRSAGSRARRRGRGDLRGAEDLPDHPEIFLTHVRGIVNQAFELIWRAELEEKKIPSEWMATWKYNQERGVEDWQTAFPQGVHRVRLLNLMTGTQSSNPCAKHVTKSTYVLMNAAHAFGEFGQHQEGAPVDSGTAYAALHLCIELSAALARELPTE